MLSIKTYQEKFIEYLTEYSVTKEPKNLYEPIQYILKLGGKLLRPVLTLLTTEVFDGGYTKALDAALSIEVFHNFSLVHDDIMDGAPMRRGQKTVHEKWNVNTGILSGDAMLIMAYQLFENYDDATFRALAKLFSKTALEVCEGQQHDVDFETRDDVSIADYLKMIEFKTAVLIGAAMKMGAIVAGASIKDQKNIYSFGKNLGIAFQLQDDYLDTFGDPETFGKQIGGDILENKKTILYVHASQLATAKEREALKHLYSMEPQEATEKIEKVKQIFLSSGSDKATKQDIQNYTHKAFSELEALQISEDKKLLLKEFGNQLMTRNV